MKTRHLIVTSMALMALAHTAQAQKEKKVRHDSKVITAEEIEQKTSPQNALDLIRALRPAWLTSRGPTTIMMQETGVSVYVDGAKRGSVDELRLINRDQIEEMRFFSASEAQGRYGMDNVSGAIEITTRKG
jgi:hypothetical protein